MRFRFIILSVILILLILQILIGFAYRVKVTEPLLYTSTIQLTADDVGVTDAVLHLKVTESQDRSTDSLQLRRDGQTIFTAHRSILDTIIFDESILPKHTYTYKAYRLNGTIVFDSSDALTINTMDTTSHNFTWEIYTLGDGYSHGLRDLAIINDTLIYAVGEIYAQDSTGKSILYNMARWDGRMWNIERVYFSYQGNPYVTRLYSIIAFDEKDIWVGTGGPYHWDGREWKPYSMSGIFNGYVNKFYEVNSSDIYMVGTDGAIAHYDGSTWQKIENPPLIGQDGKTLDIVDIYGATNKKTGELEIMAVASKKNTNYERKILKISRSIITTLSDSGINTSITGVWFEPGKRYYVTGNGIFRKRNMSSTDPWQIDKGNYYEYNYKNAIRANGCNDIVVVCDRGDILHYNGYSWKSFWDKTNLGYGNYYSVSIRGNLIVAVGDNYGCGVIAIGKR